MTPERKALILCCKARNAGQLSECYREEERQCRREINQLVREHCIAWPLLPDDWMDLAEVDLDEEPTP